MAKHLIRSDFAIRAVPAAVKRLNDGHGLHLRIKDGKKVWYQDCNKAGPRTSLSLGPYPSISLAEARRRSAEMRRDMELGTSPSAKRKAQKKAERESKKVQRLLARKDVVVGTLEHVATLWYNLRKKEWSSKYAQTELSRLKTHLFPVLGHRPIRDIRREEFTQMLQAIDDSGKLSTTGRLYIHCQRICDFAVAHGFMEINVCRDLDEALQKAVTKHHAAITDPEALTHLLRSIEDYAGTFVVVTALQILVQTLLRPGELRWAQWSEILWDQGLWLVPAARMKDAPEGKLNRHPHHIPLSSQTLHLLKQLQRVTGTGQYIFAGQGWVNPVISENTLNEAIRNMGYSTRDQQTSHGFRATARTILVERLGWHEDIVELQLDHVVRDSNGRAYNRTALLTERWQMMQAWSDYLDALKSGKRPPDRPHHGRPMEMNWRIVGREISQPAFRFHFSGFQGLHQILKPNAR